MPDIPTNNIELYLANIAGDSEQLPDFPTNKIERYLAKIAGVSSDVIDIPTNNVELYLAYIAGDSSVLPRCPTNVIERYLAYIAGVADVMPLFPTNIVERYLAKIAINGLGTEKTETGSIVHITDALAKAVKSLTVAIEPVQDLHGYSNPWPAGGGKNLCYKTLNGYMSAGTNDAVFLTNENTRCIVFNCIAGETYIASGVTINRYCYGVYDSEPTNGARTSYYENLGGNAGPFTPQKTGVCVLFVNNTAVDTSKAQIEKGTVTSSYAPYSNICPISGYTGANVYHSGADTSDADTYAFSFPDEAGTVYGGELDVINGKLTAPNGQINSYAGESLPGKWISDRDVYAAGASPTTGAQVVYELSTPVEYTLTPTEVTLLLGENNIWSDAGSTTVTYLVRG